MTDTGALAAESAFFRALLDADRAALDAVLAEDFVLIGVLDGQLVPGEALLQLVGSRELRFLDIARHPDDISVRERPDVAVVVGRTRMTMGYQDVELTASSRYAHVYVKDGARWLLLNAQGTPEVTG